MWVYSSCLEVQYQKEFCVNQNSRSNDAEDIVFRDVKKLLKDVVQDFVSSAVRSGQLAMSVTAV